jgi:hypothetical protein
LNSQKLFGLEQSSLDLHFCCFWNVSLNKMAAYLAVVWVFTERRECCCLLEIGNGV